MHTQGTSPQPTVADMDREEEALVKSIFSPGMWRGWRVQSQIDEVLLLECYFPGRVAWRLGAWGWWGCRGTEGVKYRHEPSPSAYGLF